MYHWVEEPTRSNRESIYKTELRHCNESATTMTCIDGETNFPLFYIFSYSASRTLIWRVWEKLYSRVYLGHCQISNMKLFAKIVNGF